MKDEYLNHKDFIESLKNPSLDIYHKVYHKNKKGPHPGVKTVKKHTLSQKLDELAEKMDSRFNNLENDVNSLKQDVKGINARLDGIDARLDYIVKANNLKDSK